MNPQHTPAKDAQAPGAPEPSRDTLPDLAATVACIAELEALNEELAASNRNYVEMLGFVAHELKNALATAMLSVYTVKDGYLGAITPAQEKSLDTVAHSLEDLRDMIHNYLDLSRLESGKIDITKTYFHLESRIVQPLLDELQGEAVRKQMSIVNGIPPEKVIYADAALLKIVLNNLLSNAIKYGRAGGAIRLALEEGDEAVTLSVGNDSSGIAPEQIPLLFQRFSRLYDPEYASQRGTGLGLYICRKIVEGHGGSIWAESRLGEWVQFNFTLPKGEV
jgi:signal transduction histidine kinase